MKRFLVLVGAGLLAMFVALAQPNVAGAAIQDQDECPEGTVQVAEPINQNNADTITVTANGKTFDLTYDVDANGTVEFSTDPETEIAFLVFKGPDSTIQYEINASSGTFTFEEAGSNEGESLSHVRFCVSTTPSTTITGTTTTTGTTGTTTTTTTGDTTVT